MSDNILKVLSYFKCTIPVLTMMDATHSLDSTTGAAPATSDFSLSSPSDSDGSLTSAPTRSRFARGISAVSAAVCPRQHESLYPVETSAMDHAERTVRLTPRMLARLRPGTPAFSTPLRVRSASCPVKFEPPNVPVAVAVEPPIEVVPGSLLRSRAALKRTNDDVTVGETNYVSRGRRSILDSLTCRDTYASTVRLEYCTTQYYSDDTQPLPQRRSFQKVQTVLRLATTREFHFLFAVSIYLELITKTGFLNFPYLLRGRRADQRLTACASIWVVCGQRLSGVTPPAM